MTIALEDWKTRLAGAPATWLVTGAAGFIGSHLAQALLQLDQAVVGLDSFVTGQRENLDEVRAAVTPVQWQRFRFVEGDIREIEACRLACAGVDYVLHQAALGSVPRSIEEPLQAHAHNSTGFLNVLVAARDASVGRFVYASSSSVYGDHPALVKTEDALGRPLSPYAVSKYTNELYAGVFARQYGLEVIGLRYFNVFGPRQDAQGAYSAVIPKWIDALLRNEPVYINGDGETSRDFCYIDNVIQANLLAATTARTEALNQVYNISVGERTTLNELFAAIRDGLAARHPHMQDRRPVYREFRAGDIRQSVADISKARQLLDFEPTDRLGGGLAKAMDWYLGHTTP